MTYGIEVINPGINRVILDGKSPIYVIPPIRVENYSLYYRYNLPSSSPYLPKFGYPRERSDENGYGSDLFTSNQDFDLTLKYPLTSIEPPMLFISQDVSYPPIPTYKKGPFGQVGNTAWTIKAGSTEGWLSNSTYTPIGVPGRWTGIRVNLLSSELVGYSPGKYADAIANDQIRAQHNSGLIPNLSSKFIVVGHGVQPQADGYGLTVRGADGKIVFNSDSNIAKAVGAQSRWNYNGRSGDRYGYEERWSSKSGAPTPTAWVLFSPMQYTRRYNGEISSCALTNVTGTPNRLIVGGRSGSPAHTPILWIEPMKPIERW